MLDPVREQCSFSNLTYNQWFNGTILKDPISSGKTDGYVMHYGDYASGWITPEYGFWKAMNELDNLPAEDYEAAIEMTYTIFNTTGLYSAGFFQDVLLYDDYGDVVPKDLFP